MALRELHLEHCGTPHGTGVTHTADHASPHFISQAAKGMRGLLSGRRYDWPGFHPRKCGDASRRGGPFSKRLQSAPRVENIRGAPCETFPLLVEPPTEAEGGSKPQVHRISTLAGAAGRAMVKARQNIRGPPTGAHGVGIREHNHPIAV